MYSPTNANKHRHTPTQPKGLYHKAFGENRAKVALQQKPVTPVRGCHASDPRITPAGTAPLDAPLSQA